MLRIISAIVLASFALNAHADDTTTTTTTTTTTNAANPAPATTNLQPTAPPAAPASPAPAATLTPGNRAPAVNVVESPGIPGGYNDLKVTDAEVQSAASFAVKQMNQGTLVKIVSAQAQVVAGKNFNLQLILLQNGVNYQYNVTVFVPLPSAKQPMQLTSVAAMGQVDDTDSANNSTANSNSSETGSTE